VRSIIIVITFVLLAGGVYFALQKKGPGSVEEPLKEQVAKEESKVEKVEKVEKKVPQEAAKVEKVEIVKSPTPWSNEEEEFKDKKEWLKGYQDKVLEAIKLTQTTPEDKEAFEELQGHLQKLWDDQDKDQLKKLSFEEMENAKIPEEALAKLKEELNREPSSE
jgi:hypothetical protein